MNPTTVMSEQTWAIGVMVGFPILFIALGEVAERLSGRHRPMAKAVNSLRVFVLPLLVLVLTVRFVAEVEPSSIGYKLLQTFFWAVSVVVAISFVNALLFDEADVHSWRANVPTFVQNMSRGLLVLVGLAVIMSSVWDADLKGALTALGVGSIVLGLALQGTLGGIFSGIALLIDRPFREGDIVKIGDLTGTVREMNWRSVRIQSLLHDLVVIPNSSLAEESITNLSRPKVWHVETFTLGFSYDDPPAAVKDMLVEVAKSCNRVMSDPPPRVRLQSYGDFSISYELQMAFPVEHEFAVRDELLTRVWYATKRHGFSMPFPIATSLEFDGAEVASAATEKAEREGREALVAALSLESSVIEQLLANAQRKEYTAGETILGEGGVARALFLVVAGTAVIGSRGRTEPYVEVGRLSRGDVFGGGSLLRGEPSRLSFRAHTDVSVLEIPSSTVFDIVQAHPKFAIELQRVMAQRHKAVDDLDPLGQADGPAAAQGQLLDMLTRITAAPPPPSDSKPDAGGS